MRQVELLAFVMPVESGVPSTSCDKPGPPLNTASSYLPLGDRRTQPARSVGAPGRGHDQRHPSNTTGGNWERDGGPPSKTVGRAAVEAFEWENDWPESPPPLAARH